MNPCYEMKAKQSIHQLDNILVNLEAIIMNMAETSHKLDRLLRTKSSNDKPKKGNCFECGLPGHYRNSDASGK